MNYLPGEKLQLRVDDVVWREVEDELIILELSTSVYLSLNGSARHLWEELATGTTIDRLVSVLTGEYGIDSELARGDAESFLSDLASRSLLLRGD
jgi:hypothetical protein